MRRVKITREVVYEHTTSTVDEGVTDGAVAKWALDKMVEMQGSGYPPIRSKTTIVLIEDRRP